MFLLASPMLDFSGWSVFLGEFRGFDNRNFQLRTNPSSPYSNPINRKVEFLRVIVITFVRFRFVKNTKIAQHKMELVVNHLKLKFADLRQ